MTSQAEVQKGVTVFTESKKLKRELTLLPLAGVIYFTVCGGSFGVEGLVGMSGPGLAMVLLIITPLIYSIPTMLMVREMNSMMPVEGGYYHWVKQAFGPFAGFIAGWMNWVVSWVDVSIYPVLAATYLGHLIPALHEGAVIFGMEFSADMLSWLVGILLIVAITALNIRGARLTGLVTNWIFIIMMIPLVVMSIFGIISWINSGSTPSLPFLADGQNLMGAFSTGLFIVMWNYIGWELPTTAGDEIVNPRRTYPLAMLLVLVLTIGTYLLPTTAGLFGGAGDNGRYMLWGIEAESEEGIGAQLSEQGLTETQLAEWGVNPARDTGWEFPEIATAIGAKISGEGSPLSVVLGIAVTFAAVLSMIGLFIGNSLGGTRVPFAMAEDGMMPTWLVKVSGKYGTPFIAIIVCGVFYAIFSLQAFSFLVVVDVFLNSLVVLAEFAALWKLRRSHPDLSRDRVPGGIPGLVLITLGPIAITVLAVVSQIVEEGWSALGLALAAIALGMLLYFPIRRWIKPGIPDVDPFAVEPEFEAE